MGAKANIGAGTITCNYDGFEKFHTDIGAGEIGLEGFRFILNDPRWDGIAMLLETPKEDDLVDDVKNLAMLCTLVENAERVPPGLSRSVEQQAS